MVVPKVKICGITNLEDALASVILGADALGFVFYRKSPRYILPRKAKDIIRLLPRQIKKAGVFVGAKQNHIKHIARFCKLDMLQFHGNESPEFCGRFKGYKIIKAFRVNPAPDWCGVKDSVDKEEILKYNTFAYLFDTFVKDKAGGTGRKFDWRMFKSIKGIKSKVFLSGGLNAKNIKSAIRAVKPDWVDVSSGVEKNPGVKDKKKIKEFIRAVQGEFKYNEVTRQKRPFWGIWRQVCA